MKIKLRTFILAWVVIIALLFWGIKSFGADLSGGTLETKSMALWELYRYRDVTLLRKFPRCPYKAYQLVRQYVTVEAKNNRRYLTVNADLIALTREDAEFNRAFAKAFKARGSPKRKVKVIYDYCCDVRYTQSVKTAREVFQTGRGDCAGIAAAFYVLCKGQHIPVRYVIGWNSEGCHAWNRVKISGKWYWVDCTEWNPPRTRLWKGYSVMEMW